ncbi:MAG: type III-A CRISPR-associated RAMP protein Csm3 [Patescibacteria group bacterium]|nr:type III-A CRISPR-associated RAMP protein Csm3 [Patescibacteria group bacterium]
MNRYYIKKYRIVVKTGLHIGAEKDSFEIGEMDQPVVKEFETGIPYIPGSSIKGKIKFLLEKNYPEKMNLINKLFGSKNEDLTASAEINRVPTIILVRDAFVDEKLRDKLSKKIKSGERITEEKAEVLIGKDKTHPRFIERVPVNYEFILEVVFRFLDDEDLKKKDEYFNLWNDGVKLLESDYLGGSGSRGYGKVEIEEI